MNTMVSPIKLRCYQQHGYEKIIDSWNAGCRNVLAVFPTGAGKTVLLSKIIRDNNGPSCVIAHRSVLVSQISMALAKNGVHHRIIGSKSLIKIICRSHIDELGTTFYDPNSQNAVASVDTLVNRMNDYGLKKWFSTVTLWVQDEAHHVLKDNKWGEAVELFPNVRGLGVTATPERADCRGLGRHASGVFDDMVIGPTMRDLINQGFLTDYRIICPPSNFHRPDRIGSTGDFTQKAAIESVTNSNLIIPKDDKKKIIGDVVKNYLKFAKNKLGVAFVTDVNSGEKLKEQFNSCGICAELITAKTPEIERSKILKKFEERDIKVLVNVDLFGEGFDVPAIEVVMMARPTESWPLYVQQFGRALRLMLDKSLVESWNDFSVEQRLEFIKNSEKPKAIIIDHVGNVERHQGPPDAPRLFTLDDREKRTQTNSGVSTRTCLNEQCFGNYSKFLKRCPFCGTSIPEPERRNGPEWVDGDLFELDAETLAKMRGEVDKVYIPTVEATANYKQELIRKHAPPISIPRHLKRFSEKHEERQKSIISLSKTMALWAGYHRSNGRKDDEIYRLFNICFGVDWLTAQTLYSEKADELNCKIMVKIGE